MKRIGFIGLLLTCLIFVGIRASVNHAVSAPQDATPIEQVDKLKVKIASSAKQNIETLEAKLSDYDDQIEVMGKIGVTENGTTMVSARVGGRIEKIQVTSGESVTAGQILASIYSPDYAGAREEYLQAGARKKDSGADSDFGNLSKLSYKKLQALGLTKEDIAQLPHSDPNLLPVHAPVAGVLIDKKAVLGTTVNVGDSLFTIGDLHKVWFLGDVYPEDLPRVHPDQDVLIDTVGNNTPLYGKVSFISPVIDPNTRTIKIRVLMDNPNQELRADMYVQAHLILNKTKAILIPTDAIFNEAGQNYIFRQSKEQSDIYEKIPVETGGQSHNQIVVSKGIAAGDIIVTKGSLLLNAALDNGQ